MLRWTILQSFPAGAQSFAGPSWGTRATGTAVGCTMHLRFTCCVQSMVFYCGKRCSVHRPEGDPHAVVSSAWSARCRVRLWITPTSHQRQRRIGSSQRSLLHLQHLQLGYLHVALFLEMHLLLTSPQRVCLEHMAPGDFMQETFELLAVQFKFLFCERMMILISSRPIFY